jgi:Replication-relaxation
MPKRPTPKAATTGAHQAELAGHLTLRDRWLARMLFEHKVFTTQQIVELCYPTTRAANHRLLALYKWRVVDRFQPFLTQGTAPMHYVLDTAGATALAYEDGIDPRQLDFRHEDAIGIAHSLRLAHTVGCNGFFTSLVAVSRGSGARGQLAAWWSERRCGRLFGDMVRPDGYGRWREAGQQVEFFFEFDFGSEKLERLGRKLHDYEKLAAATGIATPVLIWVPTSRREASTRRVLADAASQLDRPQLVPVATSAADVTVAVGENNPASARWLLLGGSATHSPGRVRLAELAQLWPHTDAPQLAAASSSTARSSSAELAPPAPLPPTRPANRFRRSS